MPQQLLDAADIGPGIQQVRRERVPQRVRTRAGIQAGGCDMFFQHPTYASRGQPRAVTIDEDCRPPPFGLFGGVSKA